MMTQRVDPIAAFLDSADRRVPHDHVIFTLFPPSDEPPQFIHMPRQKVEEISETFCGQSLPKGASRDDLRTTLVSTIDLNDLQNEQRRETAAALGYVLLKLEAAPSEMADVNYVAIAAQRSGGLILGSATTRGEFHQRLQENLSVDPWTETPQNQEQALVEPTGA